MYLELGASQLDRTVEIQGVDQSLLWAGWAGSASRLDTNDDRRDCVAAEVEISKTDNV